MTSEQDRERTKLPYERPKLRIIELAAEEVLAIGCKLTSGGWASGVTPCVASGCADAGS